LTPSYSNFWESSSPLINTSLFNRARNTPVVPSMDVSLASQFSTLHTHHLITIPYFALPPRPLICQAHMPLLSWIFLDLLMPSQSSPSQKQKDITTDVLPTFAAPPSPSKQPTKWWKSIPTLTESHHKWKTQIDLQLLTHAYHYPQLCYPCGVHGILESLSMVWACTGAGVAFDFCTHMVPQYTCILHSIYNPCNENKQKGLKTLQWAVQHDVNHDFLCKFSKSATMSVSYNNWQVWLPIFQHQFSISSI